MKKSECARKTLRQRMRNRLNITPTFLHLRSNATVSPLERKLVCSVSHTDLHLDRVTSLIPRELYLYPLAGFPPSPESRRDCAGDKRTIRKKYLEAENALPLGKIKTDGKKSSLTASMPESLIKRTGSGHTKNIFRHDALSQKIGENTPSPG